MRAGLLAAAWVAVGVSVVAPVAGQVRAGSAGPARLVPPDLEWLDRYAATDKFALGLPRSITVTPNGDAVLFLRSGPRTFVQDLYSVDLATGTEKRLLSAEDLLGGGKETLSAEELGRRERRRDVARGIASYTLSHDGERLLVPLSGRLFLVDRRTAASREVPLPQGSYPLDPQLSPDGKKLAYVRDGELHVADVETGADVQLTHDASETVTNGLAEFVAQEEMDRMHGAWWAPDGRTLAFERADTAGMERFHIADPVHPDADPRAWPYPRAGGRNADVRLGLVPAAGGSTTWVEWDRATYPYLASVSWDDRAPLTILVQDRAQQSELLLAVDPATGHARTLLAETDAAWLNLPPGAPQWADDGSSFGWMTERGGDWQLELRARDGRFLGTITPKDMGLRALLDLDVARGVARVVASADPTQSQVLEVPLRDGVAVRALTTERGAHGAVMARHHGSMVLTSDPWDGQRSWVAMRTDGSHATPIRSAAEDPGLVPRVTLESVGPRGFHAAVVRPHDFDVRRQYPVLVSVYGGPTGTVVSSARNAYVLQQWFADQGFIVVSLDGRGTPGRGREWQRAVRGDLASLAVEDQADGVQALCRAHPEMDVHRVGIMGWSFGGYMSALEVMRRPDVFAAGIAGAPVADWRDYDTHYTERYMGEPDGNAAGYDRASVLTWAKDLQRPLLLIHGTSDDNVYFMHSLKVADALFKAGRPFDFLPLAGFTHVVPDPVVIRSLTLRQAAWLADKLAPRP